MGARQQLAAALAEALPEVRIVDDPSRLDRFEQVVVQVLRKTIAKTEQAPRGSLQCEFDVLVVAPYQDSAGGEDELDDATDDVLEALEALGWVAWEKAERVTYNDTYIAYRIGVIAFLRMENGNG